MDSKDKTQILGASILINRYCAQNAGCHGHSEVRNLIDKFEATLGQHCRINLLQEDEVSMLRVIQLYITPQLKGSLCFTTVPQMNSKMVR